jgi:phenylalanyl-tRNA synthetase alpha subunit
LNSKFTDNPISLLIIELGSIVAIVIGVLSIGLIIKKRKNLVCHHNKKKYSCEACIEEEQKRLLDESRLLKQREIKAKAENLFDKQMKLLIMSYRHEIKHLQQLPPTDFEDEIADMFARLGYQVVQTPYSNDGGKDAITQ